MYVLHCLDHLILRVDDEPSFAMLDHFWQCT